MHTAAGPVTAITTSQTAPCTLRQLLASFAHLGTFGFGGPIAPSGCMPRDLVERCKWSSTQDYVEGLALAQHAPGPLAAQLAIYLEWIRGGTLGATRGRPPGPRGLWSKANSQVLLDDPTLTREAQ